MVIMFSFDGLLFTAVWYLFFRPEDADVLSRNLIIFMIIFALLSFFTLLQTLNKIKRLRVEEQEKRAEALKKKQLAERNRIKNGDKIVWQ